MSPTTTGLDMALCEEPPLDESELIEAVLLLLQASRGDFARVFDTAAARMAQPVSLKTLVQIERLERTGSHDTGSNAFAFRLALAHAARHKDLRGLVEECLRAGFLPSKQHSDASDMERQAEALIFSAIAPRRPTVVPEALIDKQAGFYNLLQLRRAYNLAERRICEVSVQSADKGGVDSRGSGFLVGPEVVLTNWHVVRSLLSSGTCDASAANLSDRLTVRFDHLGRGTTSPRKESIKAIRIEVVQTSFDDEFDSTAQSVDAQATGCDERLDFALIRLSGTPGVERGWYNLSDLVWPKTGQQVHLFQFPGQKALSAAIGRFTDFHNDQSRVRHIANTLAGSSGGLCLMQAEGGSELQPVAMHQAWIRTENGESTNSNNLPKDKLNQAIPLAKIAPFVKDHARRVEGAIVPIHLRTTAGMGRLGDPVFGRLSFVEKVLSAQAGGVRLISLQVDPVSGGPQSAVGKSFSTVLLHTMLPSDRNIIIELTPSTIPSSARELAQVILDRVEPEHVQAPPLPLPSDADTSETAWIADHLLATAFGPRLASAARERLVWLVIDDLDRAVLPDGGGRRFLDALYQKIKMFPSLRIVLIGLTKTLASFDPDKAVTANEIIGAGPSLSDVEAWLRRRLGPDRADDPDIVAALAKIAFDIAGPQSPGKLASAVRDYLDRNLPPCADVRG